MSFWELMWLIIVAYAFIALLMVMFSIFSDLFRDNEMSGIAKAVWVVALVFLPVLSSLVYLIVRGKDMSERALRRAEQLKQAQDAYIREAAGKVTPADQITQARAMLDAGVISEPEYDRLKEKALV